MHEPGPLAPMCTGVRSAPPCMQGSRRYHCRCGRQTSMRRRQASLGFADRFGGPFRIRLSLRQCARDLTAKESILFALLCRLVPHQAVDDKAPALLPTCQRRDPDRRDCDGPILSLGPAQELVCIPRRPLRDEAKYAVPVRGPDALRQDREQVALPVSRAVWPPLLVQC